MTLDTRIYVHGKIDYRAVFVKCNQLLGATEQTRCTDEQDTDYRLGKKVTLPGSSWTIQNEPMQGLPGWLMLHYRPDAPLRVPGDHSKYCDGAADECYEPCGIPCWLEISIDTTYSYHGPEGGCGDLHAWFTAELGRWLNEQGVSFSWRNEFTGEVHQGFDGLEDLGRGGLKALEWFATEALPAIRAHALGEGTDEPLA